MIKAIRTAFMTVALSFVSAMSFYASAQNTNVRVSGNWHVTERLPQRQVHSSLQSSWHLWASISHGKRHMTPQYSTLRTSVHGGGKSRANL